MDEDTESAFDKAVEAFTSQKDSINFQEKALFAQLLLLKEINHALTHIAARTR